MEGARSNIKVNAVAPVAGTEMLETVLPPEAIQKLKPDYVAALITFLCDESCPETGQIYEVGGGHISKLRLQRSLGINIKNQDDISPEMIKK